MDFATKSVSLNGEAIWLRELSAGAAGALDAFEGSEYDQALALVGLSLCKTATDRPRFASHQLDEARAYVADQFSVRVVRDLLVPACVELNASDLEAARGNSPGPIAASRTG